VETEEGAVKLRICRELLGRYIFVLQETEYPSLSGGALLPDLPRGRTGRGTYINVNPFDPSALFSEERQRREGVE
jgi:hypothetical protein